MAGLYLHVPFCTQRCVYCDFYFVTSRRTHTPFVQAICAEVQHYGYSHGDREPIDTLYFGGGTPSLLSLDDLHRILLTIEEHFDTSAVRETTLELNPDDGDATYLRGLRTLGFNRLSIGIQSFYQDDLTFMNRSHDAQQAEAVVEAARDAGFDNFSIDLIFGLPEQPEEYWAANLAKAIRLEVPHVSTYNLTVEPGTPLHLQVSQGRLAPLSDDTLADRYRFTMDYLREHGYEHYEVSSFARPGCRSKHNQVYWRHDNYLGLGPSAHSFWWTGLPAHRWANVRSLKRYEALLASRQAPIDFREAIDLDMLADEYVLLRLRTADGLDLQHLDQRYGYDLLFDKMDEVALLEEKGLVHPIRDHHLRLTDDGMLLCDAITRRLIETAPHDRLA